MFDDVFDAIFDSIGEFFSRLGKRTGKPIFGIICLVIASICLVWTVVNLRGYIVYITKSDRFTVRETVIYDDLGSAIGDEKHRHMYNVTRTYEVDGETYRVERVEKGRPHAYTHYFYRDSKGVAHEVKTGSLLMVIITGSITLVTLLFGIIDIRRNR